MEYYSAIKNELSSHINILMNLKSTLINTRSQSERATSYITLFICSFRKGRIIELANPSRIARASFTE